MGKTLPDALEKIKRTAEEYLESTNNPECKCPFCEAARKIVSMLDELPDLGEWWLERGHEPEVAMPISALSKTLTSVLASKGDLPVYGAGHPGEKGSELTPEDISVEDDRLVFVW